MVEVATDTYVKDGRHVVLFGVSHIAGEEFWEKSNTFLSELESKGFEVQFEGVKNDMENAPVFVPSYALMAELMGLQDQKAGLVYKKHWLRTDTTMSKFLEGTNPEKLAKTVKSSAELEAKIRELLASDDRAMYGEGFLKLMKLTPYVTPVLALMRSFPNADFIGGISKKAILDDRNDIASDAILAAESHVVAVWGANHLPGIGKTLKANGFKLRSRQWHPAY
jgi:hypothetical protein